MIVLIDNTVLSNFALINQIALLQHALGKTAATVREVREEYQEGVRLDLLPPHDWSWLTIFELTNEERVVYQELRSHLGSGESACIAIAYVRQYAILTDDRAGRKAAQQRGCPVSGTLGILLRLIEIDHITLAEADELLEKMIAAGYHSPVNSLSELI